MRRKKKLLVIGLSILCMTILCSISIDAIKKYREKVSINNKDSTMEESLTADTKEKILPEVGEVQEIQKTEPIPKEKEELIAPEAEDKFPKPDIMEPMIEDNVIPKDIYVFADGEGKIKCYFENAQEYTWEYYNEMDKTWKSVSENGSINLTTEMDELNRNNSVLVIKSSEADKVLVRCKVKILEEEEEKVCQASYNVLDFMSDDIKDISVAAQLEYEAGTYIDTLDIPIKITQKDDLEEIVIGLSNLFFSLPKDVSSDMEKNGDGTTIETVTTTTLESEYHLVEAGENPVFLNYRGSIPGKDIESLIKGTDHLAPEVEVVLSDYVVSNMETEPITITATINGLDNYSPLTKLKYAFKEKKKKIQEEDFNENNKVMVKVEKNGVWTAYVKDEEGNIGAADIEIITVDEKAPVIEKAELKDTDSGWHKENMICVSASDKTSMEYRFTCSTGNIDSGWIAEDEYKITQSGEWKVTVKDAAANESFKEIAISNIDSQPPVIVGVKSKKKVEEETVNSAALENPENVEVSNADIADIRGINLTDAPASAAASETNHKGTISNSVNTPTVYTAGGKGEKGERGTTGATGATGKDGISYYLHIKYADSEDGAGMSESPADSSKYIGVYTGSQSTPPTTASSYKWSRYKENSSQMHIRYSENQDGSNMMETPTEKSLYIGICNTTDETAPDTAASYAWSKYRELGNQVYIMYAEDEKGTGITAVPTDTSSYIGICTTTDPVPPDDPGSYTWSLYKDNAAVTELQNKINDLQNQINDLKAA